MLPNWWIELVQKRYVEILAILPTALLLLGLCFALGIDPHMQKRQRWLLLAICGLVFSLIFQNVLEYVLAEGPPRILLRTVLSIYGYSIRPLILLLFFCIISPESNHRAGWTLIIVNACIHITALFSGICFSFTPENHFIGGLPVLQDSCLITSLLLLAQLLVSTVRTFHPTKRQEAWIPIFAVLLILLAVALDGSVGTTPQPVSFLTIAIVHGCVLYYIWLHFQFEREYERARAEEQRMRIMMSQIQPHFLYNTLAAIRGLCRKDPDAAASTIEQFSRYLRQNLDALSQPQLIPFRQEMEHATIYAEIERLMFPYIHVTYDLEDEDFLLPVLTVQPLVENAILHGVRARGEGHVSVSTRRSPQGDHVIVIADNGAGFDPKALEAAGSSGGHVGIQNVRERLETLCGGALTIDSAPGKGARVTLHIPDQPGGQSTETEKIAP